MGRGVGHRGTAHGAEGVGELGPPPPSLLSPLPGRHGARRRRQRPDRPHPLLYSPVRRWQFSFSPLRLLLLIRYLVDVVPRMRKPP
jgi:hypothetical protein